MAQSKKYIFLLGQKDNGRVLFS